MNEHYKLPDGLVEQYWQQHRSKLITYTEKEYKRLCCEAESRDTLLPFDGTFVRNPDAIGRILAILFKTDDWEVLALAKGIADNDEIRESLHDFITSNLSFRNPELVSDDKERNLLLKINREVMALCESAKGKSEEEIETILDKIADCLSKANEENKLER